MKRFIMERPNDETGVSGTGKVLEGVVYSVGDCIVHWLTPAPKGSWSHFESFAAFESVHVESHPDNNTQIVWLDE